jgi:hypothetical protein
MVMTDLVPPASIQSRSFDALCVLPHVDQKQIVARDIDAPPKVSLRLEQSTYFVNHTREALDCPSQVRDYPSRLHKVLGLTHQEALEEEDTFHRKAIKTFCKESRCIKLARLRRHRLLALQFYLPPTSNNQS